MREPPVGLSDATVAAALSDGWGIPVAEIAHLPWGFGSWHWRVGVAGRQWFVTADELDHDDRLHELAATYRAARELHEAGLDLVVPVQATPAGHVVLQRGRFALSVAGWVEGARADADLDEAGIAATLAMVDRLHAMAPPASTLVWEHRLPWRRDLEAMQLLLRDPWDGGPLSAEAQGYLGDHAAHIPDWLQRYDERVRLALARRGTWVVTHGEPGPHNQLSTASGQRLVDWESMRVAPAERDASDLVRAGHLPDWADPDLVELFDLYWRLCEIGAYAAWLRGRHTGSADDRIALGGLRAELTREPWLTAVRRWRVSVVRRLAGRVHTEEACTALGNRMDP